MKINTWPGWKCVKSLGTGAFGTVYEIEREENGKIYKAALKVISIPQDESEIKNAYSEGMDKQAVTKYFQSFVTDFQNEIALMSDLKGYTNIVSYEDHMVLPHEDGIGWDILIRMELLTPLLNWVSTHPMSEGDILRLGNDICSALVLCHKNKIIHRDIKPENIFVNKNGNFKLGDFGIARMVERTGTVMSQKGTYTYMAPEVFKGQNYDETADLYSLGVVLYRFLNENRTPFLPMGNLQYTDRQIAQDRRMKGHLIPAPKNGSNELKFLVLKALQYEPENRFKSAIAFQNALSQCTGKDESVLVHSLQQINGTIEKIPQFETEAGETLAVIKGNKEDSSQTKKESKEPKKETSYADKDQGFKDQGRDKPKRKNRWIAPIIIVLLLLIGGILAVLLLRRISDNNSSEKENSYISSEVQEQEKEPEQDDTAYVQELLLEVQECKGSDDYIGALNLVNTYIRQYPEEGVFKEEKNKCLEEYERYIIGESMRLANEKEFQQAISLAETGLRYFDSTQVTELLQQYRSCLPINLGNMEMFQRNTVGGSMYEYTDSRDKYLEDNYGNLYDHSLTVRYGSITYLVNYQYETFSGTVACPKGVSSNNESATLTIYGDGEEIAVFADFDDGSKPQTFSLPISSYERITLQWQSDCLSIFGDRGHFATIFDGQMTPVPADFSGE